MKRTLIMALAMLAATLMTGPSADAGADPICTVSPSGPIDFGAVKAGESETITVEISNTSTGGLVTVNSVTTTDPTHFTIGTNTLPDTLGSNETTFVPVTYTPDAFEENIAGLNINDAMAICVDPTVRGEGFIATLHVGSVGGGVGTVKIKPSGIPCGLGCHFYEPGQKVKLTAKPAKGNRFAAWSGEPCSTTSQGKKKCTLVMDDSYGVTGQFEPK